MNDTGPSMPGYGQIAYEAYRDHADGNSLISGAALPEWVLLHSRIQEAWDAAAKAVADYLDRIPR